MMWLLNQYYVELLRIRSCLYYEWCWNPRLLKEEVRAAVLCAQVFDSRWLFVGVVAGGWQFWLWRVVNVLFCCDFGHWCVF